MATGILLVVVLFTAFTVMAYSVFQSVGDELYAERSKNLNEVSEQIARTVNSICSYSWDVSDAAFAHLLATEIDKKEDELAHLKKLNKKYFDLAAKMGKVE